MSKALKKIKPIEIENFYLKQESNPALKAQQSYANEQAMGIELPFRSICVGPSGSGKTNLTVNIIKCINNFDKIIILAKDLNEFLYQHIIKTYAAADKKLKTGPRVLAISDIHDMPKIDDIDPKENTLLIADDLVCEKPKDLLLLNAFWMRARKQQVSMIFLGQKYFSIPLFIRTNSNVIFIKAVNSSAELNGMLSQYQLGVSKQQLKDLYERAIPDPTDVTKFLTILPANPIATRFRANFDVMTL